MYITRTHVLLFEVSYPCIPTMLSLNKDPLQVTQVNKHISILLGGPVYLLILSFFPSVRLSISVSASVCLPVSLPVFLYVCLSASLTVRLRLSVHLSVFLSVCIPVDPANTLLGYYRGAHCIPVCPSVSLSVCLQWRAEGLGCPGPTTFLDARKSKKFSYINSSRKISDF